MLVKIACHEDFSIVYTVEVLTEMSSAMTNQEKKHLNHVTRRQFRQELVS